MKLPKELREKVSLKGSSNKSKKCSVRGCGTEAIRSLSENKFGKYVERAKLKIEENRLNKIYLCKAHYREVNKLRKSEEKIFQKKGFLDNSHASRKGKYLEE